MGDDNENQEEKNMWQALLAQSTSTGWDTAKTGTSTLVVLGDRVNGKSSILNKFRDRVTDVNNTAEYVLDYSYINVKNKFNLDKDEVVSRMSVWQLDDPNHSGLLTKLIAPSDLQSTAYVITVDLSKPWEALESLTKWLDVVGDMNAKLISQLDEDARANLKDKISEAVQTYVDPGVAKAAAAAAAAAAAVATEATDSEAKQEESAESSEPQASEEKPEVADEAAVEEPASTEDVDSSLPPTNLGVPLLIVGTKADYFNRVLAKTGADEKFDFVMQRIRKIALEYGAATVFTSAFGEGENIELLQDYIFSRVLGMPNKNAAKVVGSSEDISIFVPTGFDSLELINSGSTAKSGWTDDTKLSEIFENPDKNKKVEQKDDLVVAMDNESFFKALRNQIENKVPFTSGTPSKDSGTGKVEQQKAVKSFFKNLLSDKKKSDA